MNLNVSTYIRNCTQHIIDITRSGIVAMAHSYRDTIKALRRTDSFNESDLNDAPIIL